MKFKTKNRKITKKQLQARFRKASRDKQLREELGKMVVKDIQGRNYRTLAKKEPYFKFREKVKGKSPKYKKRKINITLTGELLMDIIKNVKTNIEGGKIQWVFEHSNKRHKAYQLVIDYVTKKGKKKSKTKRVGGRRVQYTDLKSKKVRSKRVGAQYKDIQKGLESYGYDYLTVTKKLRLKIVNKARKIILKKIK